jgi:hypothetical protein
MTRFAVPASRVWAAVLLSVSGVVVAAQPEIPRAIADEASLAIYRMVLTTQWPASAMTARRLVIQAETTVFRPCLEPDRQPVPDDWRPVFERFAAANATTWLIPAGQDLGRAHLIVPTATIARAFSSRPDPETFGWKGFHQTFPGSNGYLQLSAVGFNEDRSRAAVYVGHHCGGLCGGGRIYFVERRGERWQPSPLNRCMWES